jgi:hypothetical protein
MQNHIFKLYLLLNFEAIISDFLLFDLLISWSIPCTPAFLYCHLGGRQEGGHEWDEERILHTKGVYH